MPTKPFRGFARPRGGRATPSPPALRRARQPPLRKALQLNSRTQLLAALEQEPEAAWVPFYDFEVEPPLCLAVRLGCSEEVVRLLLAHGASANAMDCHGRTALTVVSSSRFGAGFVRKEPQNKWEIPDQWARLGFSSFVDTSLRHMVTGAPMYRMDGDNILAGGHDEAHACRLAGLLLATGVNPEEKDGNGNTAYEVAVAAGFYTLARLWRYYTVMQAFILMHRASGTHTGLPGALIFTIFQMLVPPDVLRRAVAEDAGRVHAPVSVPIRRSTPETVSTTL